MDRTTPCSGCQRGSSRRRCSQPASPQRLADSVRPQITAPPSAVTRHQSGCPQMGQRKSFLTRRHLLFEVEFGNVIVVPLLHELNFATAAGTNRGRGVLIGVKIYKIAPVFPSFRLGWRRSGTAPLELGEVV